MIKSNLIPTVASIDSLIRFADTARSLGVKKLKCHLKVDSGMGRVGVTANDFAVFVKDLVNSRHLWSDIIELEGIYSHMASADSENLSFAKQQAERYYNFYQQLTSAGFKFELRHLNNSAGLIKQKLIAGTSKGASILNAHRAGISLYGLYPSYPPESMKLLIPDLKPILTFKTSIVQIKDLEPGQNVSYGEMFTTTKPVTKVATLPVGYADGYTRQLGILSANKKFAGVAVRGKIAPIIGRVCMDMMMIDVSDVEGVSVGDSVILMGGEPSDFGCNDSDSFESPLSLDVIAGALNTINYEIPCVITPRVPRKYLYNGSCVGVKSIINF